MPPPELARNTPSMNVAHPLEVRLGVIFRRELDLAFFHGLNRAVSQRLDFDKPLGGESRLNDGLATIALADGQRVIFYPSQQPALFEIMQDFFARLIAVQS